MLPVSTLRSSRKKAVAGDDDARGSLAGFASSGCSVWVQAWPVGLRTSSAWALLGAGPGIPWTRPPQPSPVGHSGGHRAALAMPFWPPEWFFCLWAVRRLHRGLPLHGHMPSSLLQNYSSSVCFHISEELADVPPCPLRPQPAPGRDSSWGPYNSVG